MRSHDLACDIVWLARDWGAELSPAEEADAKRAAMHLIALHHLTVPRRAVLDAFRAAVDERGYRPTVRDLAARVGRPLTSVHRDLRLLIRDGFLLQDGNRILEP